MIRRLLPLLLLVTLAGCFREAQGPIVKSRTQPTAQPQTGPNATSNPVIEIVTDKGTITAELFAQRAPKSVANFLAYIEDNHFDGLVFHRVMKSFMIQGGGFDRSGIERSSQHPPIENESTNRISNLRYTLSMARTPNPHSATSQFFINTGDNIGLDHRSRSRGEWGYCVFGKVLSGKRTVDAIAAGLVDRTDPRDPESELSKPRIPIVIQTIRRKQ
ncbi:MAG: peptidyl-prolyl cis-trans isomerase [Phycisphaerales bacterium]|jgi:cyclophilin family peptidyl-prolyl cis-trans isomerase|nr:peptidyl-prolyl cis-trans isomerase [Phycisphaerales bacterium]MBT7170401.1 peptidyl-prolyl cis-trans isomerase [Phycisphaerales bacterium]